MRTAILSGMRTTFESGTALFIPYYIRSSCESEVLCLSNKSFVFLFQELSHTFF